jgi:hypothetical protein
MQQLKLSKQSGLELIPAAPGGAGLHKQMKNTTFGGICIVVVKPCGEN